MTPPRLRTHATTAAVVALAVFGLGLSLLVTRAWRVQAAPALPDLPAPPAAPVWDGSLHTLTTPVQATDGVCPASGGTVLTQAYWDDTIDVQDGSRIVFGAGCYYVPDELRLDGSRPLTDVAFDGTASAGVYLVQVNSQSCTSCTVNGVVSLSNHSTRVSIEGFAIVGSAPASGAAAVDTANFSLPVHNTRMGLRISDATDVTVTNVTVRNSWSDSFYLARDTRVLLLGATGEVAGRNLVSMNGVSDVEVRYGTFRRSAMSGINLEPGRTVVDDRVEVDGSHLGWVGGGWAGGPTAPFAARTPFNSWCATATGFLCFGPLFVLGARAIGGPPNIANVTISRNSADVPLRIRLTPDEAGASLDEIAVVDNTTSWGATSDIDQSWIAVGDPVLGLAMTNVTITGNKVSSPGAAAPYLDYFDVPDAPAGSCTAIPVADVYHLGNRYRDAGNFSQVWRMRIGTYVPGAFGQTPIAGSTICP